jgi:RNA polymerase sigma factor (sigma-70 family)
LKEEISKEKAEAVFREHSQYIYRVALFLTSSRSLADDITQETFMQIFRQYHKFDISKPIQPWIYKITLHTTRNILRKQRWLHFNLDKSLILDMQNKTARGYQIKALDGEAYMFYEWKSGGISEPWYFVFKKV